MYEASKRSSSRRAYEIVLGGPYKTEAACQKSLDKMPAVAMVGCRQMLMRDAEAINKQSRFR
jgi:hypothetical protein